MPRPIQAHHKMLFLHCECIFPLFFLSASPDFLGKTLPFATNQPLKHTLYITKTKSRQKKKKTTNIAGILPPLQTSHPHSAHPSLPMQSVSKPLPKKITKRRKVRLAPSTICRVCYSQQATHQNHQGIFSVCVGG